MGELESSCSVCGVIGKQPAYNHTCSQACARTAVLREQMEGISRLLDQMTSALCEIREELQELNAKKK